MYYFDIYSLARVDSETITRNARRAYAQLPTTETNLVERAIATVRAFINKPAAEHGQVADVLKTNN